MTDLDVRREGRVATITLHRPPLNILDLDLLDALDRATGELLDAREENDLQVLRIRSGCDKAFSAGVAVEDHVPERLDSMLETFHRSLVRLRECSAITVAAVHGHCLGGGMELALACDLVVATRDARFGQPEVKLGCYPPFAAALYPRRIGRGRTLDLLLTGRTIPAEDAERWGWIQRLAELGELDEALDALTAEITAMSPAVTKWIKRAVAAGECPFDEALAESERIYREDLAATQDMEEGLRAFLDKRPPSWRGR